MNNTALAATIAAIDNQGTAALEIQSRAAAIGRSLGRKFESSDLQGPQGDILTQAATAYAAGYRGSFSYMLDMRDAARSDKGLSVNQARGTLNCLLSDYNRRPAAPVAGQVSAAPVEKLAIENAGVYVMPDGTIVKVKANQAKTNTYALRWTEIRADRLNENDDRVKGEYVYEPSLIYRVSESGRKMTLDEAKAFILRYGQCCRCSTQLVAADSVEAGIGPKCLTYFAPGMTFAKLKAAAKVVATRKETVTTVDVPEARMSVDDVDQWLAKKGIKA